MRMLNLSPSDCLSGCLYLTHCGPVTPCGVWVSGTSWSTLVQVMACRLLCAKPLPEPILNQQLGPPWRNLSKIWIKIPQNSLTAFESVVCKMAAILFRHQCGNPGVTGRCLGSFLLSWWLAVIRDFAVKRTILDKDLNTEADVTCIVINSSPCNVCVSVSGQHWIR